MQNSHIQQANIYTDFSGLNQLKHEAVSDREAALQQVAKQFEGIFLSQMLKSMRQAGDVFSEGNILNSSESDFYQDMFDSQLSLSLSGGQGIGLAEVMVRQLSRDTDDVAAMPGRKLTLADYDRSVPAPSASLPDRLEEVKSLTGGNDIQRAGPAPAVFESPAQFVEHLLPLAEAAAADSGIDPRLMVAQAALETGWGRHMIEGEQGAPSFNLFGIKADSRWSGNSVDILTTEYRDGVAMKERAAFRAYDNYEASFRDYARFLEQNPRYRDVLSVADQPAEFAERLQKAGYATDPNYGSKIRSILGSQHLSSADGANDVPFRKE